MPLVTAEEAHKLAGLLDEIDKEIDPRKLDSVFRQTYKQAPREALKRPPRSQLTDEFFRDVAIAYRRAVAAGLPPGKTIATDFGVPPGTVARWIAEARERRFLPPAQQGRISADEEGSDAS